MKTVLTLRNMCIPAWICRDSLVGRGLRSNRLRSPFNPNETLWEIRDRGLNHREGTQSKERPVVALFAIQRMSLAGCEARRIEDKIRTRPFGIERSIGGKEDQKSQPLITFEQTR